MCQVSFARGPHTLATVCKKYLMDFCRDAVPGSGCVAGLVRQVLVPVVASSDGRDQINIGCVDSRGQ